MSFKKIFFITMLMLLATAQHAMANQPPGPHLLLAEILMLPVMGLFTFIGGAYVILQRVQKKKSRRVLNTAIAIILILGSGIQEGLAVIVAFMFWILATERGTKMLYWGLRARFSKNIPEHLDSAKPARLIFAGAFLIPSALFLFGMAVFFLSSLGGPYYHRAGEEQMLKDFVAYQSAYAKIEKEKTGIERFHRITKNNPAPDYIDEFVYGRYKVQIEYGEGDKSFTVHVLPSYLPPFPYNHMTSRPSYLGDETGRIRMIRVHDKEQLCPADAPVVMKAEPEDIEKAYFRILSSNEVEKP